MPDERDILRLLWAKTSKDGSYHPLICHMLDVGTLARVLLDDPSAHHLNRLFARLLGLQPADTPPFVSYLVALHDLGKASPSFQSKSPLHWPAVRAAGLDPSPRPIAHFRHDLEAYLTLADVLAESTVFALSPDSRKANRALKVLSLALGAHHGKFFSDSFPAAYPEVPPQADVRELWRKAWREARADLAKTIRTALAPQAQNLPLLPGNLSALCVALNGLAILCDWIGSNRDWFPPYGGSLGEYQNEALRRAQEALGARRLHDYLPKLSRPPTFRQLFPRRRPRPLQSALEPAALTNLPPQSLIVIEAPTGEGKTEAALLLAARLVTKADCQGFYFALPTVATSNQMYDRVRKFMADQLPSGSEATLMLVNGQAEFCDEFAETLTEYAHQRPIETDGIVGDSWLLPRKRSLLSPYGVGTVDQAMMCALNVRHVSLRLLGLAAKVLIIDEVHAYDLYMSTIIDRLLAWLGTLGASVILLSATLPRARRQRLVTAFLRQNHGKGPHQSGKRDPYPLVTIVDANSPETPVREIAPAPANPPRSIAINRRMDGEAQRLANARFLMGEISDGGTACWLLNTVREAQACYSELEQQLAVLPAGIRPDLLLFHARFPLYRRKEIEQEVVSRLGPDGKRDKPLLLVATQVVEQSLDLDFDLLMTQLAPIDLLLQRLGRLHRHERPRPSNLSQPRLVLLLPQSEGSHPDLAATARVYSPLILYKTIIALHNRQSIVVPDDVRALVEAVYDHSDVSAAAAENAGVAQDLIIQARARYVADCAKDEQQALEILLSEPDLDGRFNLHPALELDDEAAEQNEWVAAQTRLADPSVRVVILEHDYPLIDKLISNQKLGPHETKEALLHAVSISDRRLVSHAIAPRAQSALPSLARHSGLEGHFLMITRGGVYSAPADGHVLRVEVSRDLGVIIDFEEV